MTRGRRLDLLRRYAAPQRAHLLALVLLAFLPAALAALEPLALKLFIDNALGRRPLSGLPDRLLDQLGLAGDPRSLVILAAALALGTTVASYVLSDAVGLYWEWVGARMVRHAGRDVFDALQRLSPSYHARTHRGDALSRVTTDVSSVYTAVSALFVSPAIHLTTMAAIGWSAWRLNPELTIVIVMLAPITAVVSRRLSNHLRRQAGQARRRQVAVVSLVSQIVRSLPLVQAYTAEAQNQRTFRAFTDRALHTSRRVMLLQSSADATSAAIGATGLALVMVLGGYGVVHQTVSIGDVVVFLAYTRILDAQLRGLLAIGRQLRMAEVGLDRIDEVLACDQRVTDPVEPVRFIPFARGSSITFEGVSFGYAPGWPVLHDVDLEIAPGEAVALVGPTGAGKSTLIGLVSRLYDPSAGRVLIDGVDLRQAAVADVRAKVSVVRQDPLLLPATVADNIAIGRPGATPAEIERAARLALAHEFIVELPGGYATILDPSGTSLSGGQRQRLAIARAFLKNAPILILDEPTSALDAESESGLVESLRRVAGNRTVLVVAHRLATVRSVDRVLVLQRGRLVETGSHRELLDLDGLYARYHRLQLTEVPAR